MRATESTWRRSNTNHESSKQVSEYFIIL